MERLLKDLKPHPLNAQIYGHEIDPELVESIKENGILQPLLIDAWDRIISGHRRYQAALKAGLETVPVTVLALKEEAQVITTLIEANRQRAKTNEQLAREAACLFQVESDKADLRRANGNSKTNDPAKSPEDVGDAREIVATKLGIGAKKVQQAVTVIGAIDDLRKQGKTTEADLILGVLNRHSLNRAHNCLAKDGLGKTGKGALADDQSAILIKEWQTMSAEQKHAHLAKQWPESRFTPQTSYASEWVPWAWHPVTGCLYDCEYCDARDLAMQRYQHGFEPTFYPGRLNATAVGQLPKTTFGAGNNYVLTCPTADLFGQWVPKDVIEAVLDAVRQAPNWTFLFLTKNPQRLLEFEFPLNAWLGTSVEGQQQVDVAEAVFVKLQAIVKWLVCEPLSAPLKFARLDLFQWLVIGGARKSSRTGEFVPPRQWVQDLWQQADKAGCDVYETPNVLERRREFPLLIFNPDEPVEGSDE